uniref:Uncharacterized protein n=1 Tax=Triticum urartu TaxID=4572 RepID=A0A8R7PHV6_TRIUA
MKFHTKPFYIGHDRNPITVRQPLDNGDFPWRHRGALLEDTIFAPWSPHVCVIDLEGERTGLPTLPCLLQMKSIWSGNQACDTHSVYVPCSLRREAGVLLLPP